jgi:LysR family glycine cleavage system transcriptional activator
MQNTLPLNNLNTFASAASHLSFQKAAESLFVTPSAVSHQVRNLEKILGYKLFERLDKQVKLTSKGKNLFNEIKIPISQIHDASRKALRGLGGNTLALSVAPVFATGWLLPRLRDFYSSHPEINLSVVATSDVVDLNIDSFDASIRFGTGNWQGLATHHLFNSKMVVVCNHQMIDINKGMFTATEISEMTLVHNTTVPKLWPEWFQQVGITMPKENSSNVHVQGSAHVIETLQAGNSVGIIDRNFIEHDIKSGRLAIANKHILDNFSGYYLSYPLSVETLPSLIVFKEWLNTQLFL